MRKGKVVEPTSETPFDEQLPDRRCVDLEYLLLSLPRSTWVITPRETNTSLGEDLPVGGRTPVSKFTGRRRL
jgi:hypothetical protein